LAGERVAEGRERASNHTERSDADFFAVAEDFLFYLLISTS
jgi:hypothetical protein